jgi:DNA-binding beta-propeller fold protein YncE
LTLVDTASGKVMVTLPLPIRPENLCFNADGGQLFITGEGVDGVVVVYPYQSQVATTLLSGKAPGPMAVSVAPQFLFVTSPSTGTVSVLDVRTQKLAAVVAVGADAEPRAVVVTPDQSMALVLNRKSGDIAIIRLANIVSKRQKTAPLFTMIPVGSAPVAAVVRSFA